MSSLTFETSLKSGEKTFLPTLLMEASGIGKVLKEIILDV